MPTRALSVRLLSASALLAAFIAPCRPALAGAAPRMPMPIIETNTASHRWLQKPVLASRALDGMENLDRWSHHGQGSMSLTADRHREGNHSLRLVAPTKTDQPNRVTGRPFGEAGARRNFPGEDWREFNRLSVWVYPTLPGFKVVSLLIKLHNEGAVRVPDGYGREGLHFVILTNHQWNQVVWEIPHLARDKVTGVELIYRLQGHEPGATNSVCFDFDQLELQRVAPDPFEGWSVAPGRIAFSHTGYDSAARKTALASGLEAREFRVIDSSNGQTVLTRPVESVATPTGAFQLLDFTPVRGPGMFQLQAGDLATRPFAIRDFVWLDTVWKTINLFYCERCGDAIPGIHDVCHRDWRAEHQGQTVHINGGWHDAGDLSQGLVNTAEAVQAMLELAEVAGRNPPPLPPATAADLAQRLLHEAAWGLEWLLKTRFGDGHRVTWATMDFWTDGDLGNADDVLGSVGNSPFENFVAATAEAVAARVLQHTHPDLAARSRQAAEADWQFAVAKTRSPGLELAAAGLMAATELYALTRETAYAEKAFELARTVTGSQQREWPDWAIPVTGFFYTGPSRDRLLHYSHRGHEQAPAVGLAALCRLFPEHPDWMRWYSAVVLHSEYLQRIAQFTAPYDMLPASVYSLDEANDPAQREQVLNGVKLDEKHYLRRFPVWTSFRGNHGTVLTQAKALSIAARLRGKPALLDLCRRQLEWVLGRNPFACSTMFGEGHDFLPQYTAMSGDMVGSLPVGIQTRANEDQPYWPAANCYNYAEVWVHPSSRWLAILRDFLDGEPATAAEAPLRITGQTTADDGHVTLAVEVSRTGAATLNVRTSNLNIDGDQRRLLEPNAPRRLTWIGQVVNPKEPWFAVVQLAEPAAARCEAWGSVGR